MTTGRTVGTDAGESFADRAFAVTQSAYSRSSGDWAQGIQAAIAELFSFLAEEEAQTKACMAGDHAVGAQALTRRDAAIDRFTELLDPGFAADPAPPAIVAEAVGGGIYELIRRHVLARRINRLPDAVPDATIVVLAPFVGMDGAMRLARSEAQ